MYGATEASARLTCLDASFYESKMDSVGKPVAGTTIRIVDEQGRTLPACVEGELIAQGPGIMAGYWNNPETTKLVLDFGGYRTGDLGYIDEDGFIFIIGRKTISSRLAAIGSIRRILKICFWKPAWSSKPSWLVIPINCLETNLSRWLLSRINK